MMLSSCDKDDSTNLDPQSETKVQTAFPYQFKKKTFKELEQDDKFNQAFEQALFNKKPTSAENAKTVMEEEYGFTIDSSFIKEISSDSYTSYTFFIHRDSIVENVFENLVIELDSSNIAKAYLTKYVLNSPTVYFSEIDAYYIDAEVEGTRIDYNITSAKIIYQCIDIVTAFCNNDGTGQLGETHAPGPNCTNPNFMWTETITSCGFVDDGSSFDDGGGGGTGSGGNGDPSEPTDPDLGGSCRGCGGDDNVITDPVIPEEIEEEACPSQKKLNNINQRLELTPAMGDFLANPENCG